MEWKKNNTSTEGRWLIFFNFMKNKDIPVKHLEIVCQFVLSLPGTSAPIERLFSQINKYWTSEKSQLHVSTLKSVMLVFTNFDESCNEMFQTLKLDTKLLKEIHGSQKYF